MDMRIQSDGAQVPVKGYSAPSAPDNAQEQAKQIRRQTVQSADEMKQAELMGETFSISEQQLIRAIETAIKNLQGHRTSLDFSIHEATKQIMVKVIDKESGEIIREIPPEKNLDFLAKMWEMAGLLVDERR